MALTTDRRLRMVVLAASAGLFAIQLDFFSMQAALPQMAVDLDTSISTLQWCISGYMLSLAASFIAGGRLADILGRRTWLVIGATSFGLCSLIGGAAPDDAVIIAARVVQGVGGAILFTVSVAVVTNAFPVASVQRAVGLVFGISALGQALGPLAGGFFTELISWRWVLWINVPVCLAIVALALSSVEDSRDESAHRVDWAGLVLISTSIGLFTLAIDQAPDWGWGSARTVGSVAVAVALFAGFLLLERRVREPLVDLTLFRNREFSVMAAAGTVGNVAIVVAIFISMIYLQTERGFSPLGAGFAFLAFSSGVAIASQLSGRLDRFPSWGVMVVALVVGGAGTIVMGVSVDRSVLFFSASVFAGFGLGLSFSFANVVTQSLVPPAQAGAVSGVLMTLLVGAGGVGVAAAAAVANTAVQQGAGASLDDTITAILVVVGVVAVMCAPLVWAMGRSPGDQQSPETPAAGTPSSGPPSSTSPRTAGGRPQGPDPGGTPVRQVRPRSRCGNDESPGTPGLSLSTPNGIRTRAATLRVRAGPSGRCGWVLEAPPCPDFPSGPSAEHCPVTPGGLPNGFPIRRDGVASSRYHEHVPRPNVDFELDPAVVLIPDDVQGDVDEWLHSLRHDGEPAELDVTGAELVAEARDEAG
jgi:EmrB/QacA subfamily drug resistance transporter